jgi:cell division septation protein DedD
MHTRLIAAGAVLVILGAILLAVTLGGIVDHREELRAADTEPSTAVDQRARPAVLPVAAGLCLAAGAGLIGIGANRWYAYRERTTRA